MKRAEEMKLSRDENKIKILEKKKVKRRGG
jgi:hypothetical protein